MTLANCPPTFTWVLWYTHVHTQWIHIKPLKKKKGWENITAKCPRQGSRPWRACLRNDWPVRHFDFSWHYLTKDRPSHNVVTACCCPNSHDNEQEWRSLCSAQHTDPLLSSTWKGPRKCFWLHWQKRHSGLPEAICLRAHRQSQVDRPWPRSVWQHKPPQWMWWPCGQALSLDRALDPSLLVSTPGKRS